MGTIFCVKKLNIVHNGNNMPYGVLQPIILSFCSCNSSVLLLMIECKHKLMTVCSQCTVQEINVSNNMVTMYLCWS